MSLRELFPNLTDDNHEITSPRAIEYNCVAWVAKNTQRWWQPGVYWPTKSTRNDYGIGELVLVFESLGYQTCDDGALEPGYERIALYALGMMYIGLIQSLDDDVSLDDVIDRLYLLRKIELAEGKADNDEIIEHSEFMSQLEAEDAN